MDRTKTVGDNLKRIRTEKKLALSQVSSMTGVSKSMLSAIESHKKSPTISLLSTIADGLDIPMIELILDRSNSESPEVQVGETAGLVHIGSHFYSSLMFGANTNHRFSVYKYVLPPTVERVSSEPHGSTWEYCLVLKGSLHLVIKDETYIINEREMVWFPTYLKHVYKNPSSEPIEFLMLTFFD